MKKVFAFLSCVVMFLLFTACPSSDDSSPESNPEPEWTKESDWLFLFYFDADNNLNDEIYTNMRQAEYSLALMRNEDGSAKTGFPTVNMVALWDGESRADMRQAGNRYAHPNGALYELGADYDLAYYADEENEFGAGFVYDKKLFAPTDYDPFDFEYAPPAYFGETFKVGANTTELTSQASSWLTKEPDMGNVATLTNFLSWVNRHYKAQNVVLCMSDHGAGAGKEQYTDTTKSSRTLCADDSSRNYERMISTKNIRDALSSSGYTGGGKIALLWMDVCLQASAEIAYDLKGCANFLLASPNLSVSHEYSHALKNMTKETTPEQLGKLLVSEYYHCNYSEPMPYDASEPQSSGGSMYTMSLVSLDSAGLDSLKAAVDSLADSLLALKDDDESAFFEVYTRLLAQDTADFSACAGLSYAGSYAILSDIGFFADGILSEFPEKAGLCAAADSLKTALRSVIVYAYGGKRATEICAQDIDFSFFDMDDTDYDDWPEGFSYPSWGAVTENQMYLTGGTDYLTQSSVETELSGDYYGLTIETQNAESEESLMREIASYIKYFTGREAKAMTFDGLCKELQAALVSSKQCSRYEAALMVSELKAQLSELDYVSHYYDYTGFSESWAKVIAAWFANSAGAGE